MKKSLLLEAVQFAKAKMHNHPEFDKFIHFSFIVQHNKIIGYGRNCAQEPSKHYGYHQLSSDKTFKPKTHSEINAFKKTKGIINWDWKFSIINVRLNRLGQVRLSKPCRCCYNLLKALGCSEFYYSSDIGFLLVR